MLILRLWNYLKGYVIIVVEGYFLEKFINICSHRQLRLWNVRWHKDSRIMMKIGVNEFRLLRPVARKTKCRVRIVGKKGLPFILYKYKNRKAFAVGSGIFLLIFFLISSFVWDVSVTGNEQVATEVIMEKLHQCGVREGALKYSLKLDEIVDSMMLEINDLARISISLRGTKIFVDVSERRKPPELIDKKVPCDIVAAKDGVIASIIAKDGIETVKVGETVMKGQMLISGTIENTRNPEAPPLMVHSIGAVKARIWYQAESKVEQTVTVKQKTGAQKNMYSIILFAKKYKLFHGKNPYNNSEHIEVKKRLSIGPNFALPIEWLIDQYEEYEVQQVAIDPETAKKNASEEALQLAQQQVPQNAEIVSNNVFIIEGENGAAKAVATVECIENIGVSQRIGGM